MTDSASSAIRKAKSPSSTLRVVERDEYFAAREGLKILRPASRYARSPARLVNPEATTTAIRHRYAEHLVTELPSEGVARFPDATVFSKGMILTDGGDVLAESIEGRRQSVPTPEDVAAPPRAIFETAVSVTKRGSGNYGHFLVEMLPRLALNSEHLPVEAPILMHRDSEAFALPMLEASGISRDRIVWVSDHPVAVRSLYWPTRNCFGRMANSPHVFPFLRDLARDIAGDPEPTRRLFLGRRDARTRRLVNDAEVFDALEPLGFEWIAPGHMPFREQVEAFAEARVVVAVGGAALTNMTFMPPGGDVLMLGPQTMAGYMYWDLATHCELGFSLLFGENLDASQGGKNPSFSLDARRVAAEAAALVAKR